MGLRDKAKKSMKEGDKVAEEQATALEGLMKEVAPEGVAADAPHHELERAQAALKAQGEEHEKAQVALREEVRKLSSQVDSLRSDVDAKDQEINDLHVALAKERAAARERQAEHDRRAEIVERELANARATLK